MADVVSRVVASGMDAAPSSVRWRAMVACRSPQPSSRIRNVANAAQVSGIARRGRIPNDAIAIPAITQTGGSVTIVAASIRGSSRVTSPACIPTTRPIASPAASSNEFLISRRLLTCTGQPK